jgi:hypothetical protein
MPCPNSERLASKDRSVNNYISVMKPRNDSGGEDSFVVCLTYNDAPTWSKYVMELAEFTTRKDADEFIEAFIALVKVAKPKSVYVRGLPCGSDRMA